MDDTIFINSHTYSVGEITKFKGHTYKCIRKKDSYMTWWKHQDKCEKCKRN